MVLEMFVDESLEMIVDESLEIIEDESLDMIVDEPLMIDDKSLEKLVDETLKLDEEHFEFVIADDYHSIKYDVLLVSVYTTGNVTIKGMLIPDDLHTDDIYEIQDYKDIVKEFFRDNPKEVDDDDDVNKKKDDTKNDGDDDDDDHDDHVLEDVEKIIEGIDEELYASEFPTSIFLDEEDFGTRLEPVIHKDNPKEVDDDDDVNKKKDDTKNDGDDDDDHDDHALVRTRVTGSFDIRNEKIQTPIPS
nr:hypothetical protein [Tanacetum cinerariifolium]